MALEVFIREGIANADAYRAEVREKYLRHQVGLKTENDLIDQFIADLQAALPTRFLVENGIEVTTAKQKLVFVDRSGGEIVPYQSFLVGSSPDNTQCESLLEQVAAEVSFDERTLQFFYSDFASNFRKKYPLPPHRGSFDQIGRYLGNTISWIKCNEDDLTMRWDFEASGRQYRDTLTSINSQSNPI